MTELLCRLIQIYVLVFIARIILDWIPVPGDHPVGQVRRALGTVTDPLIRPLRRVIPPLRLGTVALDLSPLVVIIGLNVLANIICRI